MSEVINHTLYCTPANGTITDYELQVTTTFDQANFEIDGLPELVEPQNEGDEFKVVLKLKAGNKSHIVHDFSIGLFPPNINIWILVVEYKHADGQPIERKKRTEQTESEVIPRPLNTRILG